MPKTGRITELVKAYVDRRGGTDAVKQDFAKVRSIVRGPGSFADKVRRSADVLKAPNAHGEAARRADGHTAAPAERVGAARGTASPPHDRSE